MTPEEIAAPGTEAAHQMAYFCWMQQNMPTILAFHPANGEKRDKRTAARLRAMGVKPGVLDIWVIEPRYPKNGLIIEMKVGKNKPSNDQKWWIHDLTVRNYVVVVCYTWIEAVRETKQYLRR